MADRSFMAHRSYVEVHVPNVRFTEGQIRNLGDSTGIVSVEGLHRGFDGTFGAVRITFADNAVLEKYCYAYRAMRVPKR